MPEWRKDPIQNRWVIVAEDRGERPCDYESPLRLREDAACPFCEGNEDQTTPEIAACRAEGSAANGPGWRVRVVPNKYPALELAGEPRPSSVGHYDAMPGVGVHEVIVESPRHVPSTADLGEDNIREVLWTYRDRLTAWKRDPRLRYGMVFKNVGAAAGASLEHVHSQLVATPMVPTHVGDELAAALALYQRRGECPYCELLSHESSTVARVVLETPHFVAFCPFASRFAYETWILPKRHASRYESISRQAAGELAGVLKQVVGRLETALDRPAYNYILQTAPFGDGELPHYHWRLEVFPRLARTAGFEWGTGFHINAVPPERAAAQLRDLGLNCSPLPPAIARY